MSQFSKIYPKTKEEWILRSAQILLGLTFFVPFVVIPSNFVFPFIVPKILLFRSLVLFAFACYTVLLLMNWEKYKVRMNWLHWTVLLFWGSLFVSTFAGVDWYRSFWDNHERMLGLFTLSHYILFYFLLSTLFRTREDWKWLFRLFLVAGSVVMFIGVIQKYINPDLLLNRAQERVSATLGNAIYFSGYGLFLFFLGMSLFVEEKKKEWKWTMFGLGILGLLGVFIGGTRGTLLGVFTMIAVCLLLYSLFWKENKQVRMYLRISVVVGVLLLALLGIFRDTEVVKSIPGVQRFVGASLFGGSGETRLMAWKIAVEGSKEHILFGWGPNNYYYLFNKYYNPEFLELGWGETWFDNAHSAVFNTLAVQGVIGIVFYFSLFGVAVFSLYSLYRKNKEYLHYFVLGSGFLIGHFVHNAFVFENPTSYLYFFFALAFVASLLQWKIEVPTGKNKGVSSGMMGMIFFVVIFFAFVFNVNPARANMSSFNSLQALVSGRGSMQMFENVLQIPSPHRDDIRSDIARTIVDVSDTYVQAGRKEEMITYLQFAQSEIDKNMALHPADVRLHLLSYEIQKHLMTYRENTEHVFVSERVLEDALQYSPERQQLLYNLALIKVQVNKPEEAIKLLQTAVDGDPNIMESWWRLASVYQYMGDNDKAMSILDEGEKRVKSIGDYDKKIIQQLRDYVPKEE